MYNNNNDNNALIIIRTVSLFDVIYECWWDVSVKSKVLICQSGGWWLVAAEGGGVR